ncbi:Nn.00g050860.m01.CDS01 [Neocucurbitaria sp. VM-36]
MSVAQSAFSDGFGINVTKLSDDLLLAIRNEIRTLRLPTACNPLQDDLPARDAKLNNDISSLNKINHKLQRDIRDLHSVLESLVSSVKCTQIIPLNISDAKALPPILRVGNTDFTYSLVGPEGTLASFLAARHFATSNHSIHPSSAPAIPATIPLAAVVYSPLFHPNKRSKDEWRSLAIFYTLLSLLLLYHVSLVGSYVKSTADAQLRFPPRLPRRNKQIEFWMRHRGEERQKMVNKKKMSLVEYLHEGLDV